MRKVALVTGSTRGIGLNIVQKLAQHNYNVIITGKSTNDPVRGDIYKAEELIKKKYNVDTLAIPLDIRNLSSIENCIEKINNKFNRLDVLINNASALWWTDILSTTDKRYDLINNINTKGTFNMTRESLPLMLKNNSGHIINHSPPLINVDKPFIYKNMTAYMISKFGMSMVAMGVAEEFKNKGIVANTIWPKTAIETDAVIKNKVGTRENWRKPDIVSDAIIEMLKEESREFTGKQLIDEEYLKSKGVKNFSKYNCVKNSNPMDLNSLFKKNIK